MFIAVPVDDRIFTANLKQDIEIGHPCNILVGLVHTFHAVIPEFITDVFVNTNTYAADAIYSRNKHSPILGQYNLHMIM